MSGPCSARCKNQRNNCCQLDDPRIDQNRVEFGEEWDPVSHCTRYQPRKEKKSGRKQK
jgi:hypothetical protein